MRHTFTSSGSRGADEARATLERSVNQKRTHTASPGATAFIWPAMPPETSRPIESKVQFRGAREARVCRVAQFTDMSKSITRI